MSGVTATDFADMQGLVRFGHGKLKAAEFLLLDVADAAAARTWLAAAPVTTAEKLDAPPPTALQVAFTAAGLRALGVEPDLVAQFPQPFLAGMAGEDSRSRRLGDIAGNDPSHWHWGRPQPHLILMLYAEPGGLDAFKAAVTGAAFDQAFTVVRMLPTNNNRGVEPFGFVDGVSEPVIDWEGTQTTSQHRRLTYANLLAPGEVVLGHPNEYGEITSRPLVRPETPGAGVLPAADDAPRSRDFGRNGTYLVLRQLHQDVRGFWRFLDAAAGHDADRRVALAEAMVGRHLDGRGLIPDGRAVPGGRPGNNFVYDADPDGHVCPVGAHIRRANPRTGDHPPGVGGPMSWLLSTLGFRRRRDGRAGRHDLVASARFHRIVRRGREYGVVLSPEDALVPRPGRGARPALRLPLRQHRAPVRIRAERLDRLGQVRWPLRPSRTRCSATGRRSPAACGPTASPSRAGPAWPSGWKACRPSSPCAGGHTSSCPASGRFDTSPAAARRRNGRDSSPDRAAPAPASGL